MKRSPLLVISGVILLLLGLLAAARFPVILVDAKASGISAASSGRIVGAALGSLIWLFLAAIQWRGNGRWALGIGIFALIALTVQCGFFFLAVQSQRVHPGTFDFLHFIFLTVLALSTLAFVNLKLHAARKHKSG